MSYIIEIGMFHSMHKICEPECVACGSAGSPTRPGLKPGVRSLLAHPIPSYGYNMVEGSP